MKRECDKVTNGVKCGREARWRALIVVRPPEGYPQGEALVRVDLVSCSSCRPSRLLKVVPLDAIAVIRADFAKDGLPVPSLDRMELRWEALLVDASPDERDRLHTRLGDEESERGTQ